MSRRTGAIILWPNTASVRTQKKKNTIFQKKQFLNQPLNLCTIPSHINLWHLIESQPKCVLPSSTYILHSHYELTLVKKMLFQHTRYVKALSISTWKCICHLSNIVLVFITLAKRHRLPKDCVQGENAFDLLNKENRCICMLNCHLYSKDDKNNSTATRCFWMCWLLDCTKSTWRCRKFATLRLKTGFLQ